MSFDSLCMAVAPSHLVATGRNTISFMLPRTLAHAVVLLSVCFHERCALHTLRVEATTTVKVFSTASAHSIPNAISMAISSSVRSIPTQVKICMSSKAHEPGLSYSHSIMKQEMCRSINLWRVVSAPTCSMGGSHGRERKKWPGAGPSGDSILGGVPQSSVGGGGCSGGPTLRSR